MTNFFLKLLLCPGAVFLADVFSPAMGYTDAWQIIYTGAFIGILGYVSDVVFLRRLGTGVSAVLDAVLAAIVVYFSPYFIGGVYMTFAGALLSGALVGIGEYLAHRLLMGEGYKPKKQTA